MTDILELEQAIEKLPDKNLVQLASWLEDKCRERGLAGVRDHSAFLNSYSSGDEGLYDEPAAR